MDNVNKTLYIPLYGKACVSSKGLLLPACVIAAMILPGIAPT